MNKSQKQSYLFRLISSFTLGLALLLGLPATRAKAGPIDPFGLHLNYAVIDLGSGTTLGWNSGPVNGSVLVGNGVKVQLSGGNNGGFTNNQTQFLYYDNTAQISGNLQNPISMVSVPTSTTQAALTAAQTASATASGLTATQTFGNINNTLTITGNGGLNVINVANIQNAKLTLSGTASDVFVFNVSGQIQTNQPMTLTGGVTAGHILFNLTGTGNVLQTSGGNVLYGTFLATNGGQFQFSNLNLTGALVNTAGNIQLVSGSLIAAFVPFTPGPPPTPGSISGTVFCDANNNGIQDAGEPGLQGVTVNLFNNGACSGTAYASQTTASDGSYSFTNLPPGTYCVAVVTSTAPPSCNVVSKCATTIGSISLASGQAITNENFCFTPPPGSISGTVYCDTNNNGMQDAGEPGLSGVQVNLFNNGACTGTPFQTQTTGANGSYSFTGLPPGTYCLAVNTSTAPMSCNTVSQCSTTISSISLVAGQAKTNENFCFTPPPNCCDLILPTVAQQGGISEVVAANPNTSYVTITLQNIPSGFSVTNTTYLGWCIDTYTTLYNGVYGHGGPGVYYPHIYCSANYAGLASEGITTSTANWNKINYILNHKPAGANATTIQLAIWHYIGGGGSSENDLLCSGQTFDGVSGEGALEAAYGFSCPNLTTATAIVADADANGGTFQPGPGNVFAIVLTMPPSLNNGYQNQPFFIEVKCPSGVIGGTVYCDKNGDKIQESGEPGLQGVSVTLSGTTTTGMTVNEMTVTAADGTYSFTGLAGGTYTVVVNQSSVPSGCNLPDCSVTQGPMPLADGGTDANVNFCFTQPQCVNGILGGINLGGLANKYLFFFANGTQGANWQGATKGFAGNVLVNGGASFQTSGNVPYAGTISTDGSSLGAWQAIVNQNSGQAFASTGNTGSVSAAKNTLVNAIKQINALPATSGYSGVSASSLNGLNTTGSSNTVFVINVTSGFQVSSQINITGNANQIFILRWDTDANPANGYQGQVKFQSGGAIVPHGGLTAANFINVAGDIASSGGGNNPPAPYPQGPGITGGSNWGGGGFFTGYWLTTGAPTTLDSTTGLYYGATSSLSNAIFVGGWYTCSSQFSLTSGTSGIYVQPNCP